MLSVCIEKGNRQLVFDQFIMIKAKKSEERCDPVLGGVKSL